MNFGVRERIYARESKLKLVVKIEITFYIRSNRYVFGNANSVIRCC